MQSHDEALARLCDAQAEVSAHWLISGAGKITALVPEELRAWHAGAGRWGEVDDVNSRSIGIELDNRGDHPFSEPQMAALERLLPGIMQRHTIAPRGVIGHSCMAPGRKSDPGPRFDWTRLARQALATHPGTGEAAKPTPDSFRQAARARGFTAPCDDATLLAAVRLRFRPGASGPLATDDLAVLHMA